MAEKKKSYLVQMFDSPNSWVTVLGTDDRDYAIAFARKIDGEKRVTEYPGGTDVPIEYDHARVKHARTTTG